VTMTGFGTFAEPVTVDFEGVDTFALVGATGAGKSTVIDAMCFALYGSVPRYADRRAVGAVVHSLANEAKVGLDFELAGQRYSAVRVVRRDAKGKASTKEARLERADGEVLAGTAKEMDGAVGALIGLDFDQFTRAVVLPQGDFARFLHDKPADRQDLLVRLLGLDVYERMRRRAADQAKEHGAALERDEERIAALAHATPQARADLVAAADACATAHAAWQQERGALAELAAGAVEAEAEARTAADRAAALRSVSVPADLDELAGAATAAREAEAAACDAAEVTHAALDAAEAAVLEAGDGDALVRARDTWRRLAEQTGRLAEHAAAADAARAAATASRLAADEAARRSEEARTDAAAHIVREHLVVGDPCPVCEQTVTTLPDAAASAELKAARQAAKEAEERAGRDGRAADQAAGVLAAAEQAMTELRNQLDGVPDADAVDAALARLEASRQAAAVARTADKDARAARERAARERTAAERTLDQVRTRLRETRDVLHGVGLAPPAELEDPTAAWGALVEWTSATLPEVADAQRIATDRAAAARAEYDARTTELFAAATVLELDVAGGDLDALISAAATREGGLRQRIAQIDGELAERERLTAGLADRAAARDVAKELSRLLDAAHFERWLVSEAFDRLVAGGSERLEALSDGRYSFDLAGSGRDLLVVDHTQGDERRSVRTLSGGETFQASLALALALSDQLADLATDGAARLESIFLDEGFGTLDADTLETVATTIEGLGADDRMVGVVTHVAELAGRLPTRFRVTRHGSGSRVDREDG
jgi:exonuclease SbcC